jgi:hypothetical protein
MLTKMTNLPSRWSLTMWWPIECFVWLFKKSSLEILHGCAPLSKVVENLSMNKSFNMAISWKWLEHAQTGPTSQDLMLFLHLEKFLSHSLTYSVMSPSLRPCIFQSRPNQLELQLTKSKSTCSSTRLSITSSANSSWIRSFGSSKIKFQSAPSSSECWAARLGSRLATGHCHRVGVLWRPYTGYGLTSQVKEAPLEHHDPTITSTSASASLSCSLQAEAKKSSHRCSDVLARAHHRITTGQTTSLAPP